MLRRKKVKPITLRDVTIIDDAKLRKAITAASLGNAMEWFDFGVYGFVAYALGKVFFPGADPSLQMIAALGTFSVPFLIRPLGGLFFGMLGDKYGRQKILAITIVIMSISTFCIGLIPSYATIGIWAPILLLICKMAQGFSVGGEYTGASIFVAEYSPDRKRGFMGSWLDFGSIAGFVMGAGIVVLISTVVGEENFLDWGWRIPFFLALPMGAVALWLRVSMEETPSFVQQREKPVVTQASTAATFKTILMGIGRVMVWSAAGYTYLVIMPTYLQSALHTGFNQALLIAVISNIGFALTIIPSGMLSDRIGRRTVMIIATVLLLILALPLLKILQAESSTLAVKAIVVLIAGGLVGMLAGPGPAMLSEMFPTRVRYTGLGLAYSLSNAIFSGCAGLIITGLIKETGNLDIPAYYVMATAVVSIFALMTLRKDDHLRSLEE